jgi:hypothetical protein
MAAANRNLEEELDTLKAGLDTLRKDIGSRVSSFGDAATDEVKTRGRRARAAVGRVTDRAGEMWDDAPPMRRADVAARVSPPWSTRSRSVLSSACWWRSASACSSAN